MTDEKRAALRLLLNQHAWTIRSGIVRALNEVLPVPAVQRAIRTWERTGRQKEFTSLEKTVDQILDVLHRPVTKTVLVNRRGTELDLVTLPQAASRLGYHPYTLHDMSVQKDDFPPPLLVTDVARIWVFEDVESFIAAHQAAGEFRGKHRGRQRKAPPKENAGQ